ncbi:MAG: hypothetical protein AAF744_09780 [Pseudomonadota bacterium]
MTYKFLITASTIATLAAAPMAMAQTVDSASDLQGNSPNVTEGGFDSDAGSIANADKVAPRTRQGIGIAAFDPTTTTLSQNEYDVLAASVGGDFETSDGVLLGEVTGLAFDGQGNPEIEVDLLAETKIDAETLVMTILPENLEVMNGKIFIDVTYDELYLQAQDGSKRDDESRTNVVIG